MPAIARFEISTTDPAALVEFYRDAFRWRARLSEARGPEQIFDIDTGPGGIAISIGRTTTGNVKRWRDGTMVKRWAAAGMLNAERSFRRLKGCKDMPALVAALAGHTGAVTPSCHTEKVA